METITAEQAIEAAKGLTFEKVWAALMETRQRMEESNRRTDKILYDLAKRMDESYKKMDEEHRKTEEAHQKSKKLIDEITGPPLQVVVCGTAPL